MMKLFLGRLELCNALEHLGGLTGRSRKGTRVCSTPTQPLQSTVVVEVAEKTVLVQPAKVGEWRKVVVHVAPVESAMPGVVRNVPDGAAKGEGTQLSAIPEIDAEPPLATRTKVVGTQGELVFQLFVGVAGLGGVLKLAGSCGWKNVCAVAGTMVAGMLAIEVVVQLSGAVANDRVAAGSSAVELVVQSSEAVAAEMADAGIATVGLVTEVSALVVEAMVEVRVDPGTVRVSVTLVVEVFSQVVVS